MIRRTLLPGIGICAALAVGIALGAGPLTTHQTAAPVAATVQTDPVAQQQAAFGQKWATEVGPDLYAGRLSGQRVVLITLPGAPAITVQQLRDGISVGKGVVSAQMQIEQALLRPHRKVAVDTLSAQYAAQSHGMVNRTRPAYQRMGQIIGTAVGGIPVWRLAAHKEQTVAGAVTTAQETLRTARLATVTGGQAAPALALVVLGPNGDPQIVGDLLRGLSTMIPGIVVAGGPTTDGGLLAGLRAQQWTPAVMTVDGVDTVYGRTAALAGLVAQRTPHGGAYGASGIDGLVPLG